MPDLDGLPGAERVRRGLRDLEQGVRSVDALLLCVATYRLRRLGLPLPESAGSEPEPDLALYDALCAEPGDDAYGRYNALRRELVSFLDALEARLARQQRAAGPP